MQRIVIAGCGYIGIRVADLWRKRGAEVTCLVRTPEKIASLAKCGYQVIHFDIPESLTPPDLNSSILYYFVPPPGGGISDTRARTFLEALDSIQNLAKIIYMSATSVYSETKGGVVTEESPTEPSSAMGKRRLDAENAFRDYCLQKKIPGVILRVSGIYGSGRLPLMQIEKGEPLLSEDEAGPSNRIHADDLADICVTAGEKCISSDIFNVSDGNPASMTDYFNAVADKLGLPRQPKVTLEEARRLMSPLMFSYVSESRIVDNSRMLEKLDVKLRYPGLKDGLKASL
ncbi:MAG: SDR family oxidoreductase [Deltaproteobacteria bacterium]